ncbi:hypothetical protein BDY17DRAFT_37184 [Neohortaea acidophila]|uniref:Uncharacterized protein n=1 Tax=Neohortaea acidophila TaxID=245834 RepID=A0A6A6PIK4_9PEZI|nr:uncharacterized protein BDY17DRAFT_37184 [Neohortaea acidophila]KAF2479363.1 hypothetical protein BDY17DRAFT_37184 [Neohortaea acidophila]
MNPTLFDLDNDDLMGLGDLGQITQRAIEGEGATDDQIDVLNLINQSYLPRDLNPLQRAAITNTPIDRLNSTTNTGFLTRLRKTNPVAKHSANLVIDALCAIPEQMLRRATFPPFIHAHWHRQTLPQPLAVCMRIAQMFALRTPDVTPFIWRTILAEQRRFVEQAFQLSKEDLLAAMQAHIVYLTMRIIDGVMESPEWNVEMATSHTVVCDRFLELCNGKFCEDEQKVPSLTWEDWIFAESRRRQASVQSGMRYREWCS